MSARPHVILSIAKDHSPTKSLPPNISSMKVILRFAQDDMGTRRDYPF
jgi:hypothetical protein